MIAMPVQQQREMSRFSSLEREEEQEQMMLKLPASIQAMLMRANRILTKTEIQFISGATPDHRCEALRMIFDGKSADEAVTFLLNASRGTPAAAVTDPPTRAATMVSACTIKDLKVSSSNRSPSLNEVHRVTQPLSERYLTLREESELDVFPSTLHVVPMPRNEAFTARAQQPPSPSSTIMTQCRNNPDNSLANDRGASPPIRVPWQHLQQFSTVSRHLNDVAVNIANTFTQPKPAKAAMPQVTEALNRRAVIKKQSPSGPPVNADRRTIPITNNGASDVVKTCEKRDVQATLNHKHIKKTCSAWDEHFKTFIVHPNQLRRLEAKELLEAPPAAVRPGGSGALRRLSREDRHQCTRQNTLSKSLRPPASAFAHLTSTGPGTGGAAHVTGMHSTYPSFYHGEKQQQQPCVPPLKGVKNTRRKDKGDVFTRLYSSTAACVTPRPASARERALVASGTPLRRTASVYTPRTPRGQPLSVALHVLAATPRSRRALTTVKGPATRRNCGGGGGGGSTAAEALLCRRRATAGTTPPRFNSAQKLQRTATANDHSRCYARTATWSARYESCIDPFYEFPVQRVQQRGRGVAAGSSHGQGWKRSATTIVTR
ncbi:hypothetical protein DQ04_03311050 [Trypanosoma grayi]|uniref:hypothetical protein n=1 Tax=Trypanosoma grayi TaxID=71804 RepID=UPI0004F47C43|nr:hypothetical protein DQ04_03311050 [Trypanosoma grayi]KEG10771.1 hypothetical protein DQ04_03311050 [Trypanosoma grayi]